MPSRAGIPNKRTQEFRARLDALCAEQGFDLIGSLVATARGEDPVCSTEENRDTHAMQARKILTDYAYPKLKALEVANVEPVRIVITDESEEREAASDPLLG